LDRFEKGLEMRSLYFWMAILVVVANCCNLGCSPTSQPNYGKLGLVDVSGVLSFDGRPLSNVELRLETPEDLTYSYAVTDASGRYRLSFDSRTHGIIPGRKRVVISRRSKAESDESGEGDAPLSESSSAAAMGSSEFPECYGSDSRKHVEVLPTTRTLDIELKPDCT
jgi:hypothetical protein